MNLEQRLLIKKNLDILLRRKRLILFSLLVGIMGGVLYYLQQPKIYESTALIRYQRQSVNPTAMSPDDDRTRTADVVNTVGLQVSSRTSLEEIIMALNLYPAMQETMPMKKITDIMRKEHIKILFLEGGDTFQVSFQGPDQQKVMDTTNILAQKFIEENSRFRQSRASITSTYIKDELAMAKEALDKKEKIMRDYKLRYHNEMSDQLMNNTNRLNALQERYQNLQTSRLELERTRLLVQDQIAARIAVLFQQSATASGPAGSRSAEDNVSAAQIQLRLQSLQSRYTDKHPEVKRLKKLLSNLQDAQNSIASNEEEVQDPHIGELKQQLKDIEYNIGRLKDERLAMSEKIKQYEEWIAAAPVREAEWAALTRDYDQLNEYSQSLVTQSLQADSAKSLENQLQGSQFTIVDTANYPEKPSKPNFVSILFVAVAVGLGVGGVFAFSLELLGTSFKNPAELETYLNLPVVCALPSILTKAEIREKKAVNAAKTVSLILIGTAILSSIVYFWQQGTIIL
jgi:polysaccharide chain length determinant protein (PEP-CTERM system associated)